MEQSNKKEKEEFKYIYRIPYYYTYISFISQLCHFKDFHNWISANSKNTNVDYVAALDAIKIDKVFEEYSRTHSTCQSQVEMAFEYTKLVYEDIIDVYICLVFKVYSSR